MACPTCDHTMESIGDSGRTIAFWCPRCGTLDNGLKPASQPKLVERCRIFCKDSDEYMLSVLGIREAINIPGERGE